MSKFGLHTFWSQTFETLMSKFGPHTFLVTNIWDLMSEFGLLAIFVTIQLALTAYKSKSGLGRIQRFFFKSIGVETVDGWRLKEDATVEDKVFPIRGNSTCLDKGMLQMKQNSAGKLPGKKRDFKRQELDSSGIGNCEKNIARFFCRMWATPSLTCFTTISLPCSAAWNDDY